MSTKSRDTWLLEVPVIDLAMLFDECSRKRRLSFGQTSLSETRGGSLTCDEEDRKGVRGTAFPTNAVELRLGKICVRPSPVGLGPMAPPLATPRTNGGKSLGSVGGAQFLDLALQPARHHRRPSGSNRATMGDRLHWRAPRLLFAARPPRHAQPECTRHDACHGNSQASKRSHGRPRSAHSNGPLDRSIRCADLLELARVIRALFAIQPNPALAELGRVLRGLLPRFHKGHPSRFYSLGNPGRLRGCSYTMPRATILLWGGVAQKRSPFRRVRQSKITPQAKKSFIIGRNQLIL